MNTLPPVTASPAALAEVVRLAEQSTAEIVVLIVERNRRLAADMRDPVAIAERKARIDNGLECLTCGNRNPDDIVADAPCGVATFKCLACRTSWFDTRECEPEPHLEPEWFDAKAGL